MLAGLLGQGDGHVTGRRVLPGNGSSPDLEVSFEGAGVILGIQTTNVGTYVATARPDGSLFGEGQGIMTTPDGEIATWKGQGMSRAAAAGVGFRGVMFFHTACARLVALNSMAVVFEFDADGEGKIQAKFWEWR